MQSIGVTCFYYKYFEMEDTITCQTRPLFGKSKTKLQTVSKKIKETDKQLWIRINQYINEQKLEVINVESIYQCQLCTGGGNYCNTQPVTNKCVIGYRIFHRLNQIDAKIDMSDDNGQYI